MKPLLLLLAAPWLLTAYSAAAAAPAPDAALKAYGSEYQGYPLSHPRMSAEGRLVLNSESEFYAKPKDQSEWLDTACARWVAAIRASGAPADPSVVVLGPNGGMLIECGSVHGTVIESWDNRLTPFTGVEGQVGNFYISFGGQASFGGAANSYGFNMAEGITLLKRRFDLAITVGMVNTNTTVNIGGLMRYRFPIVPAFGLNLGIQPQMLMSILQTPMASDPTINEPKLVTNFNFGFLGGLNFYLPSGSLDLTFAYGTVGTYSALAGYTFFFNIR